MKPEHIERQSDRRHHRPEDKKKPLPATPAAFIARGVWRPLVTVLVPPDTAARIADYRQYRSLA